MKTILRYIHAIILAALVAGGWWLFSFFTDEKIVSGESEVKITAEEIKRMLEINAASQKVQIRFDTTYTDIAYKMDWPLKLGAYTRKNRLKENRTWLLKAGSSDFKIVDAELFIQEPGITSCEEMNGEHEIIHQEGIWHPVAFKAMAMKSKSLAKKTAIESGIVEAAKINIETAFSGFEITVTWIN